MKLIPESLGYEGPTVQIIFDVLFFVANTQSVILVPLCCIDPMIEFGLFSKNISKVSFNLIFCDKSLSELNNYRKNYGCSSLYLSTYIKQFTSMLLKHLNL